jgi:hypothetical protein
VCALQSHRIIGVPLALGSYWGLAFMLLTIPILMVRILDEEAMLRRELDGYAAYTRSVRYRLSTNFRRLSRRLIRFSSLRCSAKSLI